jgi:uncharacterized protein (TIGR03083 family)
MGSMIWGPELAEVYDETYRAQFELSALGPVVDVLAGLAMGGPVLEFAAGTGRVALPLSARGIAVRGLELSPHMAQRLRAKPGADAVPVTIGDMTNTRVPGSFTLVYLVANTIMNVTAQDGQLAVFVNAAAHLDPGGCFVLEVIVPQLRQVPPGQTARVFTLDPDHVGIETFDDPVAQIAWSHHWMDAGGRLVRHSAPYRYVWPSELDLMAKIAGFRLRDRWAGWDRAPFTSASTSHVTVYEKNALSSPGRRGKEDGMDEDRFFAELRACTAELARTMGGDLDRPVPTCPGWTFRQLTTHVGRGHRWAAQIVATRSAEPIPMREVAGGKLPEDPAQHASWLNAGADQVVEAVRAADGDLVWTLGGMGPASFWARRRAHETAVHLADAQLAAGRDVDLAPDLAADGVDEWLGLIAGGFGPAGPPELRGDGQTLHFHATDPGLSGTGEWLVTRTPSGVSVEHGHGKADVAVRGPAVSLLLILTRRLPPSGPAVEVFGEQALLTHWLEHTPF